MSANIKVRPTYRRNEQNKVGGGGDSKNVVLRKVALCDLRN